MKPETLGASNLDHRTLEAMRVRAVQQVQSGESPEVVTRTLGPSRGVIYEWLARYRAGGWDALQAKRIPGRPRRLTGHMMKWVFTTVTLKNPLQMKYPFALWTRGMIATVIKREHSIDLSVASVGGLLAQLGLTCQRPLFKAYEQNPGLVETWLREEYPKIRAQARKQSAGIYFGDEAGVGSDHHSGTTWAARGETPFVRTTGARFSLNVISAISARGNLRFMVVSGRVASAQVSECLRRLMYRARRPVFLILDGHPMHKAKRVMECIAEYADTLRLFFLPAYSPELNPDELVWQDLKTNGVGKASITSAEELHERVSIHMETLKGLPRRIRASFQAPHTKYASA